MRVVPLGAPVNAAGKRSCGSGTEALRVDVTLPCMVLGVFFYLGTSRCCVHQLHPHLRQVALKGALEKAQVPCPATLPRIATRSPKLADQRAESLMPVMGDLRSCSCAAYSTSMIKPQGAWFKMDFPPLPKRTQCALHFTPFGCLLATRRHGFHWCRTGVLTAHAQFPKHRAALEMTSCASQNNWIKYSSSL
jgi:hypothetical protein